MLQEEAVPSSPGWQWSAHRHPMTYAASLAVTLILAVVSVLGLLYQTKIYPTDELQQSFVANDVVNLVLGLPILLGSLWLVRRGRLAGLLFWPGALFFVFYNAVAYVFALPANLSFLLNLLLLALSAYTLVAVVATIDAEAVRRQLAGAVPERMAGGALFALGALFIVRTVGVLAAALINTTPIAMSERALLVADLAISPALVIGGFLLWRRRALGYVAGVGLLFQASMLFIGLIAVFLLQPVLTSAPLRAGDVIVVAVMGLVAFVPFVLFLRGIISRNTAT